MPLYDFKCDECSHTFEEFQTIAEMDIPLKRKCPKCSTKGRILRIIGGPRPVDPVFLENTKGLKKPTKAFNERLHTIKKKYNSNFDIRD
ncbi:hypothetical protein CMI39_02060 [Candidatus Pacearchaeota archaeon]|jgi:putative FmdB family regulatory protein|nr:hypothetical protein [Candidatus Pacearchaeota archaeon]|tara:strand:+ start:296 stop:562 length:267 start_codon:yes stop_codon:yes gene_type:complete